ncbi:MAG: hypothetical protein KIT22_08295 [Verrucomicrobiae bacterium]|nr:hypothetical protein [Verrucomicrobiae bacterium]
MGFGGRLHFKIAECTRFLRRIRSAMRPGGRVVILEFVPNEDRVTPPGVAGFNLALLGTAPEGDAYTCSELGRMLADAGFRDPERRPLPPTMQSAVLATA